MPKKDELELQLAQANENIANLENELKSANESAEAANEATAELRSQYDDASASLEAAKAAGADPELQDKLDAATKRIDDLEEALGERSAATAEAQESVETGLVEADEYCVVTKRSLHAAREKLTALIQDKGKDTQGVLAPSVLDSNSYRELNKRVNTLQRELEGAKDMCSAAVDAVGKTRAIEIRESVAMEAGYKRRKSA